VPILHISSSKRAPTCRPSTSIANAGWDLRRKILGLLLFCTAGLAAPKPQLPQISILSATVQAGSAVVIKVAFLSRGTAVSALQFDLATDSSALKITSSAGTATTAACKSLATSVLANGRIRFVILGLSQTSIGDGDLAVLNIQTLSDTKPGNYTFALYEAEGSTRSVQSVGVAVQSGVLQVKK